MKREKWLDCIRGVSIICVIVQHLLGTTHYSQVIESMTLAAVPVLILCMGITMRWGYENAINKGVFETKKIYEFIIKKSIHILSTYLIATVAYLTYTRAWSGYDFPTLLSYLENFSASGPFYFIRHYINLTLFSPILLYVILHIDKIKNYILRYVFYGIFLFVCLYIGYISIGYAGYTSESYLFIYALGMIAGNKKIKGGTKVSGGAGLLILVYGYYSTYKFYMARVFEGNYNYSEGIDGLMPNLQLNPPNISSMLFSIGLFFTLQFVFISLEKVKFKPISKFIDVLGTIGKGSLDIFLYHLLIKDIMILQLGLGNITSIVAKKVLFYSAVICIPLLMRRLYEIIKSDMYKMLTPRSEQP